jgi:uncharacterized protein (TIGR01777 family)
MRVIVAGGTGLLGVPLVSRLRQEGHDVTVLTRQASPPGSGTLAWQPDGTTGPWASAFDGADAVVNLAGASIADRRWTASRKQQLVESRLRATRSLAAAVAAASRPPPVLLSASAVGYYGARGDEVVAEGEGPGPDFLGQLAVKWESAADAARSARTRVVLLRTGVVLTPDGGALERMLPPFRFGVGGPLGSGRQYMPWIHLTDWTALAAFLLARPDADGPFNATAPSPVTNAEFSATLARVLRRPSVMRVPAFALRLAFGELADVLLTGQRVVPARAQALGFRFEWPQLEGALRNLLGRDG